MNHIRFKTAISGFIDKAILRLVERLIKRFLAEHKTPDLSLIVSNDNYYHLIFGSQPSML
tara:strand:- start:4560 stop:4739 length:180 start_codon:yes stop_codon:yes gene_type:complete